MYGFTNVLCIKVSHYASFQSDGFILPVSTAFITNISPGFISQMALLNYLSTFALTL